MCNGRPTDAQSTAKRGKKYFGYKVQMGMIEGMSLECIYQWIWDCKKSNRRENAPYKDLYTFLRHGRRRFKRGNYNNTRGTIKDRVSIEDRPEVVKDRESLGDVEFDLMMGKDHKSALLVMTERDTLITTLDKLERKDSKVVQQLINQRVSRIGSSWIKTMTFDNGTEFAGHKKIDDEHGVKTYFTRPYTSQDKGTVENRIGLIRRFLPKKTDLNLLWISAFLVLLPYGIPDVPETNPKNSLFWLKFCNWRSMMHCTERNRL